ncbi:MAG: DUF2865 domain-containing protein [Aliihoeflea sp.]
MLQRRFPFFRSRSLAACLLAAGLLAGMRIDAALAQSQDYCRQLEAQFAALGAGSRTNPQQIARYDNAIAAQQGELLKAREQASRAGCGNGGGHLCASLDATIQRMSRNLSDLQQTRQRLGSSAGLQNERIRVAAAMRAEGCGGAPNVQTVAATPRPDTSSSQRISAPENGTRFRTLCVRMCDGFFFPISHSTPPSLFERDAKLCAARCPGTPVELHYHRFPGEESEDMVSVPTGLPYRDGENAFRYRQASWERPANCGCSAERGFDVLAGGQGWQTLAGETGTETSEQDAPSGSARASVSGSFMIQQERPAQEQAAEVAASAEPDVPIDETITAAERPADDAADGDRRVRVVGPTFLPAPEEAIDLRSPAPDRAR